MRGLLVLAAAMLVVLACSPSYPPCYRGEYQGCSCESGARGYQACSVTEDGFQSCVCDGTVPGVDAGRDASKPPTDAGAAFLAPCGANATCTEAGNVCFTFPSKGQLCTKRCTTASECPAPSPGCTPTTGVCKAP